MNSTPNIFKEYLESANQYEDIDYTLIDELLFNIDLAKKCKDDININGIKVTTISPKNGMERDITNPSCILYSQTIKNINMLMISLGISVKERQKLKLALENVDEFDKIMNM